MEEVGMKKLAIAAIATASLPVIVALSATALVAQPNPPGQVQHSTGPDASQLDMDAVPSLNEDKVRRAQQALQTKGFDPGPIDGIIGPRTEDAIRSFQDRYGIKATAKLDNQTLYALGAADLAGPEASEPD